mmetsp:Transcript_12012/g.36617  ORF Transcript_12012/g.36617 Transcript_12012/m.36617 type:complete len:448 (-) Transcript_12012:894-2237(-)
MVAAQLEEDAVGESGAEHSFRSLGLCEELCAACERIGYRRPTRIQEAALPLALDGRDVIGLAQTGSGKTAAFALPILHELVKAKAPVQAPFALVVAPTRELVFQIQEQFEVLGAEIGARSVAISGGVDMMTQAVALAKRPHIVVASPGRLVDHLEHTKGFSLRHVRYLVLDEADRLLNMDFEKELDKIVSVLPRDRRSFLFSATMTSKVKKLQRASLRDPAKVEVADKYSTVDTLVQNYMFIAAKYKDCYLAFLCNEFSGNSIIVFVDTQNECQRLALLLRRLGFEAICIHGGMQQSKRLGALHKFKARERNILIATDVAARGLDIPAVDLVVNYDIPMHGKDYIHRVGRTARAGRAGRALSLVSQYDVELYQRVEQLLGKKLEEYKTDPEVVLMLQERVSEAQRLAAVELRELMNKRGRGRRGGEPPADNAESLKSGERNKKRRRR